MASAVEPTADVVQAAGTAVRDGLFGFSVSTPEAIFVSAIVAAILSGLAIRNNWIIARKRATIDHISRIMWDEDYIDARQTYIKIRKVNQLTELISKADPTDDDLKQKSEVISVLNDNEIVALAINRGIMDEDICFDWRGTAYVKDWSDAEAAVSHLRGPDDKKKAFVEFEALAKKWKKRLQQERDGRD